MSATVHLVDASPYLFRAYFAVPHSIRDPQGRPINAVHGFAGFLVRLLNEEQPTHLALAFDESLTTSFRNEFFPGYKASRALPPPELDAQLGWCRELGDAIGAATFSHDRYEADDILATLCGRVVAHGDGAVIVTNDKDLSQLVSDTVTWFDFAKGKRYGPAEVEEKLGVPPHQVIDLQGLCGDSVDDIPGVKGVGPKSAAALLAAFGSLEAIYEHLDEVEALPVRGAKSLRKKLAAGRDDAFLSKRLAHAVSDVPITGETDDLEYHGADRVRLQELCDRLGFGGLPGRVPKFRDA